MKTKFLRILAQLSDRFASKADAQNTNHNDLARRLKSLSDQMQAVETLRTPQAAARLRYLAEVAEGALRTKAQEAEASFESALREHGNLRPGPYSQEIRASLKALAPRERVKAIQALIEAKDGPSLSAIFDAPALLTGLSAEDLGGYREQFFYSACPDLTTARDTFRDLTEHVKAAIKTSLAASSEYSDPVKLRELELREAEAAKAQGTLEG